MKTKILIISMLCIALAALSSCSSSGEGGNKTGNQVPTLNISVFIDLSDRIADKKLVPNQVSRDTAIINYIVDYFVANTMGINILKSENKMKVFFYPTPADQKISELSKQLSVDVGEKKGVGKRVALENMKETFPITLDSIYTKTLESQKWPGCDIWDFFQSKRVDNLCIKNNARNILVILTDGYIYHEKNAFKDGNSYSYIGHKNIEQKDDWALIDKRNGELSGKGLEVLMLEINPVKPSHKNRMTEILEKWFKSMGVEKFVAAETDANITNTETILKNFLEQQ